MVADAIGSVAVIVAALLIIGTGWGWVDPAFAIALAAFIVPRAVRLASQAIAILLQAAPAHVDVTAVEADLAGLPGVVAVHDLHVWTLSSNMDVATAHLRVAPGADTAAVLAAAQGLLRDTYRVEHATLQIEPEGATMNGRATWCVARSPEPTATAVAAHHHVGPAMVPAGGGLPERVVPAGRGRHRRA